MTKGVGIFAAVLFAGIAAAPAAAEVIGTMTPAEPLSEARIAALPAEQRAHWEKTGGGYGIHWPDIDEDLSTEGLLRGAPAPRTSAN